jgi:hypothetical protein
MKVRKRTAATAPRANANADGRPAELSVGDQVIANDHAPGDYRGRGGIITEVGPGTSEFRIEFEDGRRPTTGYLISGWLDRVSRRA